jgi:hypothetical protein
MKHEIDQLVQCPLSERAEIFRPTRTALQPNDAVYDIATSNEIHRYGIISCSFGHFVVKNVLVLLHALHIRHGEMYFPLLRDWTSRCDRNHGVASNPAVRIAIPNSAPFGARFDNVHFAAGFDDGFFLSGNFRGK